MRSVFAAVAASSSLLFLSAGCECSSPPQRTCVRNTDCPTGNVCLDMRCVAPEDGGVPFDARADVACGAAVACGATCCAAGEVCGDGACCAATELCGATCCAGDDRSCVAGVCVLECALGSACGEGGAAVCCDATDACVDGACITPSGPCDDPFDCPEGEYCELSIGGCLPRRTDLPTCEYRPDTGAFELAVEWHWESDPTVMPDHDQVMSAPMVANLTDDNGDGAIDENDVPDVVFNTFRYPNTAVAAGTAAYNADGVLRVISGADGSRIWPTTTPAYSTNPALEVAIADVDASSPGPEIVGCTFPPGSIEGTARLTIFSATGSILRRFDTAPADVGCGRPAIADMDRDGVAEIVVSNTIVRADGSSAVTASLPGVNAISVMYDVDGDGDLELIGINGVAHHDGTILWQDAALWNGHGGYVALADVDLDGDPDLVSNSTTAHQITVRDARTGTLLAGPLEITPSGDAVIDANVERIRMARPDRDPLTGGGPPTIANFDEDPEPEIAMAGGYAYVIFENDLTIKWYEVTQDTSSRATGSSVFDFEGDGLAEVLYNDELFFRAFRGPTGDVYLERCNTSGTLTEYPIVVDVDNDDHAEIVLVENDYAFPTCAGGGPSSHGVWAFGHPTNQWVRTRRIWNEHGYHVTNIEEDGTLPVGGEAPNFSTAGLNNFRQNVQPDGLFDAPDLVLRDLTFATSACTDALLLRVRVANEGRAGAPASIPVSFYVDGTYVGQTLTLRPLLPGASEVVELRYAPVVADTVYEVSAILNDPAHGPVVLNECRDENNGTTPIDAACPGVD